MSFLQIPSEQHLSTLDWFQRPVLHLGAGPDQILENFKESQHENMNYFH